MSNVDFYRDLAPWVGLAFGVGYFLHGARESTRNRQRHLRKKLRKLLRDAYLHCSRDISDLEVRENPNTTPIDLPDEMGIVPAARPPQDYAETVYKLECLILEGLSSPNGSHLNYIQTHLQIVYLHWLEAKLPYPDIDQELRRHNSDTGSLLMWLRTAQRELKRYIRITAKIDDGSYFTYLMYKYRNQEIKLRPVGNATGVGK